MRKRIIIVFILVMAVTGVISLAASGPEGKRQKDEFFRQVSLFSDTLAIIHSEYVDEVNPRDLIYGALEGMLSSLDAHSHFMDPDTYNELRIDSEGKFGGVGLEITMRNGLPTVVTPMEDSPAWKAGAKANDIIVKINEESTRDMSLTDAVKRLRGKPGEAVVITVLRESEKKVLELKLVRDVIKIKDIKEARVLDDGIGYVRIAEFGENTAKDLDATMQKLGKEGMNALILDLRNNPGGLLEAAVKVAERFIEKGKLVVYTKGRKDSQNLEFFSRADRPVTDMPLVVLINEGSASGSEIVAGCLQDYKRAVIVGMKSFGKGVVQTVIPLGDGSAVSLTTCKYFTPAGKEIQGKGVVPDVVAEAIVLEPKPDSLSEDRKQDDILKSVDQRDAPAPTEKQFDFRLDNQIMRSIDVLKALRVFRK